MLAKGYGGRTLSVLSQAVFMLEPGKRPCPRLWGRYTIAFQVVPETDDFEVGTRTSHVHAVLPWAKSFGRRALMFCLDPWLAQLVG